MRRKKHLLAISITVIFLLFGAMICRVNSQWPNLKTTLIKKGQSYSLGEFEYEIEDAILAEPFQALLYFNPSIDTDKIPIIELVPMWDYGETESLILAVKVKLSNRTDKPLQIGDSFGITAVNDKAWGNASYFLCKQHFNPEIDFESMGQTVLQANESMTIILPYNLYKGHFSKSEWSAIKDTAFSLVLSSYPERVLLQCNQRYLPPKEE